MATNCRSRIHTIVIAAFAAFALTVMAGDQLTAARLAAVNGDHARCAALSDKVRKSDQSSWYAHQVYASCESIDARKKRDQLGRDKFESQSLKAIAAIEDIVANGKNLSARQRIKFSHMAVEMRTQLQRDLDDMEKR